MILRAKFLVDIVSYNQVRGLPFGSEDLLEAITGMVAS
jgi:2-oxoglutarate ferredoxin oxidoreductase subunit alpha